MILKKTNLCCFLLFLTSILITVPSLAQNGCTTRDCHQGICDIVPMKLEMMQLIKKTGQQHGDPDGCIICHGGNPNASKKKKAHKSIPSTLKRAAGPKSFYPAPGSIWIVQNTCGVCHPSHAYRSKISLMNTEAGKIQGNISTWGFIDPETGYQVKWGNYSINDKDGPVPSGMTQAYETYMDEMKQKYPGLYPDQLTQLPSPKLNEIEKDPRLAVFTYQRQECQRCHIGVKGKRVRGDHRGLGCAACHMPYTNDGYYMGNDKSIPSDQPGHISKHTLIGNRKTGGIPVDTCVSCHNRGKRIGVSFQGLMESAFSGPFDSNGSLQPKLHGKTYLKLSGDLHHQPSKNKPGTTEKGLLCQDCHTSLDVHGDGNIHGTTLAQVEIECTDCHGTPEKFPWELPLGHGDEFEKPLKNKSPRGVTDQRLLSSQQFGVKYDTLDGLLLTARGNPFGNVVKNKNSVILHSSGGTDFTIPLLKQIQTKNLWEKPSAKIAMSAIPNHLNRMECYTCHSSWAPQCYGCHVKVDYQKNNKNIDWIASGSDHKKNGQTAESIGNGILSNGKVTEQVDFLNWENPVLGINGEGRISPIIPGCQVSYTVIDKNGKSIIDNHMPKNPVEAQSINQTHIPQAIDMAPVQPHTTQKNARTCESCHLSPKTAGMGSDNLYRFDWTRVVSNNGVQLVTVGSHWPASRAFNKDELDRFLRTGTCMACHKNMDTPSFWEKISTEETLDTLMHEKMLNKLLLNKNQTR